MKDEVFELVSELTELCRVLRDESADLVKTKDCSENMRHFAYGQRAVTQDILAVLARYEQWTRRL